MFVDQYVANSLNDRPTGGANVGASWGDSFGAVRWETGLRRPYLDQKGRRCCTISTGRMVRNGATGQEIPEVKGYTIEALQRRGINSPVFNASLLPIRAWIQFDEMIQRQRRLRLQAWEDLAASSRVGGFDAMAKMTYEYQAMTDAGEAVKDMDGTSPGRTDRPALDIKSLPLPITHSDFYFSEREIATSRNTRMPLDTTMGEMATRRVLEMVEQTTIGTVTGMTYGSRSTGPDAIVGTSTEYGYTNFPYRITKTDLHTPATATPENVVEDVIEMRETMYANGYFGPFMLYHSTGYDRYLDDDYFRTGGTAVTRTLRERLMSIGGIQGIRRLDYLTSGYQLLLVQMDPAVAQAIAGLEPTVVQWEGRGGMQHFFMVMAILVPLLRAPQNQIAGILHGTTS